MLSWLEVDDEVCEWELSMYIELSLEEILLEAEGLLLLTEVTFEGAAEDETGGVGFLLLIEVNFEDNAEDEIEGVGFLLIASEELP